MERKLGQMLVNDEVISAADLDKAMRQSQETGASLGRVLVDLGLASEWEMAAALGKQLNVPFITLSHYEIDRSVLDSIPEEIVRRYRIVPVDKTGDTLTIALSDPSNIYLLDELRLLTKCQIIPVISFETDILEAIERYYTGAGNEMEEMLKEITDKDLEIIREQELVAGNGHDEDVNDLSVSVDDAPVIQLVNLMVSEAIKMRASDIHIEPYEKSLRVRYRIDGVLQEIPPPPKKFQNAIISRIKILSELDIAERRLPQDGRFKVRINGKNVDFRVSTCPMAHGEKVVLRILDQSNLMLDMRDLGFETEQMRLFEAAIRRPYGMILVTGPTGSGKSTTLYSALSTINDPHKNITTIEDPIEYLLPGINQVQAKPDIGLSFAEGLKSFLRQDPDIMLVGEIRDLETAEIAIKAALTGHLVLSTLHTNDAPSSIQRLTNMGVEPFLVVASVIMCVAQRLTRRICDACAERVEANPDSLAELGTPVDPEFTGWDRVQLYHGRGCQRCSGTGYRGRLALYEIMAIGDKMRDFIMTGATTNQLKKFAIQEGMKSLRQSGLTKIIQGKTTIEEVLSVTVSDEC
ncbi:MAG: type IV-A pilus assembly ATPase PilB [Candidatus Sumerlaeia bacterium]|nr:type IV-A pilus assembly ATPase PilB [Candidatus Sumerlaeia bacterium]